MTKLTVVLGSTREGRMGEWVFNYFKNQAQNWEKTYNISISFVDLKQLNLPFFYEAVAPLANPDRQLEGNAQVWLDTLKNSDGVIFLTPEYNWATPAVLRNALDYVSHHLSRKATRVISYAPHPGGGFDGGRDLAVLLYKLGSFVLPNPIAIRTLQNSFTPSGELLPEQDNLHQQLSHAIKELAYYAQLFKNNSFK